MIQLYNIIDVAKAVTLEKTVFIDVRSPSEYAGGHILNAINIPVFDDEERAQVGTLYRQVSVDDAKQLGLSFASSKLPAIVEQVRQLTQAGQEVIIYCWRGGMRSKSIVSVLDMMGIAAAQLRGGYKAYRQYVLDSLKQFAVQPRIVVLCGSTGTGKTILLQQLANRNIPVIDLEQLANHRGSVFGQIGLGQPATAQNFDAMLLHQLAALNDRPYIVVECESKRIGNVYLPDCLYMAMQQGKKILVSSSLDIRVERLIAEYLDVYHDNAEAIIASISSLRRRLGNKNTDHLLAQFTAGQIEPVVKTLLVEYYDPMYGYEKSNSTDYDLSVSTDNTEQAIELIIQYLQQLGR